MGGGDGGVTGLFYRVSRTASSWWAGPKARGVFVATARRVARFPYFRRRRRQINVVKIGKNRPTRSVTAALPSGVGQGRGSAFFSHENSQSQSRKRRPKNTRRCQVDSVFFAIHFARRQNKTSRRWRRFPFGRKREPIRERHRWRVAGQ